MKPKIKFWIWIILVALIGTACSTKQNSGQGQEEATKPPPQVRVEALPTATELPPMPTEAATEAPTVEPTAAQVFFWAPPSSDDLANQIEAQMDEIDQKLKSQNINIKP